MCQKSIYLYKRSNRGLKSQTNGRKLYTDPQTCVKNVLTGKSYTFLYMIKMHHKKHQRYALCKKGKQSLSNF